MEKMSKSEEFIRKPDIVLLPHEFGNDVVVRLWIHGEELITTRTSSVDYYPMVVKMSLVDVFKSSMREARRIMDSLNDKYGLKDWAKLINSWVKEKELLLEKFHELRAGDAYDSYVVEIYRHSEEYEHGSADKGKMRDSLRRFAEKVYKDLIEKGAWGYLYQAKASGPEGRNLTGQEESIRFGKIDTIDVKKGGDEALFSLSLLSNYSRRVDEDKTEIRLKREYVKRKVEELGRLGNYQQIMVYSDPIPFVMVVAKTEIGKKGKEVRLIEVEKEGLGEAFVIEIPASILFVHLGGHSKDIATECIKKLQSSLIRGREKRDIAVQERVSCNYIEYFELLMFNESSGVKVESAIKEWKSEGAWKPNNERTLAELDAFLKSWSENKENEEIIRLLYPDGTDIKDIKERLYLFVKELPWSRLSEYKSKDEEKPTVCIGGKEFEVITGIGLALHNLRLLRDFDKRVVKGGKEEVVPEELARVLTKWTLEAIVAEDITEEVFSSSKLIYEITTYHSDARELRVVVSMNKGKKILLGGRFVKESPNSAVVVVIKLNNGDKIYEKTFSESDRIDSGIRYYMKTG